MGSGNLVKVDRFLGKLGPLDPTRLAHDNRLKTEKENKAARIAKNAADELAAQNEAADAANLQISTLQRRRRLSSLFAGGRSVLGAPAGRGAPAGGGSPATSSALAGGGAGGSRSYGGGSFGAPSRSSGTSLS